MNENLFSCELINTIFERRTFMFRKLCLLTVLVAMVAITANVAQAVGPVMEPFGTVGTIDGVGAADETVLTQTGSGLTWGGYNTYTGTKIGGHLVEVGAAGVKLGKWPATIGGAYAYTEFPSLIMSNGAKLKFVAEENTMADVEVSILLKADGVWYVSDAPVIINDTAGGDGNKAPYDFDPATATWDSLSAGTNATIYSMADGDEAALVPDGVTGIVLTTELGNITGGGFFLRIVEEKDNIMIDDIVWEQDPTINAPPDPRIGDNQKKNVKATPYFFNFPQSLNGSFFEDDDKPGPAAPSWALTSATSAIPEPVFWKTDGIGGPRYDASDTPDPNIDLPVGIFVMHLEGYDGDLYADPNATATRTVVNNKNFQNLTASAPSTSSLTGGDITVTGSYTTPDDDEGGEFSVVTTTWYLEDGPAGGAVAFGDAGSLITTAGFSGAAGVYTLRLEAHEDAMGITEAKDANELVDITVYEHQFKFLDDVELTDDTFTRGGSNEDDVNGADNEMDSREGTNAKLRRAYVKFDTSAVSGSVLSATFSAVPFADATFDSAIYATTYGDGGEWFEHELSDANNVLVKGAVVATQAGPQVQKERVEYALSDLVQTPDGKTTLQLVLVDSNLNKGWYTKEKGSNIPKLSVLYDPNGMYNPSPADGALGVDPLLAELSWKAQKGNNFEVFFGPSAGAIVSIGTAAPIGDTVTFPFTIGPLATSTSYTWYVIGDDGATPGPEWTFASVDLPINVTPAQDTAVTPGNADEDSLSWTGGDTATTTDLYIGTDEALVIAGDSSVKIADITQLYRPDLALSGDVNYGGSTATYYWKLVANTPSGALEGDVTSFDVDVKSRIDNFTDGLVGMNATWAASGTSTSDEPTVVLINGNIDQEPTDDSGATAQSLKLVYNEPNGLSAVTATFSHLKDMSVAGSNTAALRFQFHGGPGNDDPGVLTITLIDDNDVNAVQTLTPGEGDLEDWDEYLWANWDNVDVSLDAFVGGADRSAIKSMTISIGDGEGTESGAVYFDLFQLYSTRCLTRVVDFYFNNSDCAADVNEVVNLAERWLVDMNPDTVTGSAPGTAPVMHFTYDGLTFDGTKTFTGEYGHTTAKTGGANPSQDAEFAPTDTSAPGNSHSMRVDYDLATDSKMETTSFSFSPNDNASVSVWVKPDPIRLVNRGKLATQRVFQMKANGKATWWKLEYDSNGNAEAGGTGIETVGEAADISDLEGNWVHLAYVHDYDNNRNAIYVNGILTEEKTVPDAFPGTITNLRMPNTGSNTFGGLIDEFKMFDYALTQENVVYLADEASVSSPRNIFGGGADLNNDGVFNIADLAELGADYQRNNVLFP